MGFLYFLADEGKRQVADVPNLREYGLHEVLADCAADLRKTATLSRVHSGGPGGGSGLLIAPHVPGESGPLAAPVVQFQKSSQRWEPTGYGRPVDEPPRVFIGWSIGNLPTPESLLRLGPRYTGYRVRDQRDVEWMIPVARSPDPQRISFPADYEWDERTGDPVPRLKAEFSELWEIAQKFYDFWNCETLKIDPGVSQGWVLKQVARVLAVNYRVGPAELNAWRTANGYSLIDDSFANGVSLAVFDRDIIELAAEAEEAADQKKSTEPDCSPSTPGGGD